MARNVALWVSRHLPAALAFRHIMAEKTLMPISALMVMMILTACGLFGMSHSCNTMLPRCRKLQYYATKMSEMKEPFMTAVFTASSHHPFQIPEKYKKVYPEEGLEMHKCIRYTDMAIGKFFEKASKEPWFKNTIFVLTSDHTNMSDHAEYQTDLGGFCSPIIIYEPGVTDQHPEMQQKIAQQIDILPTVMGLLHYPKPYFGFGIDVLNTPAEDTWAVNYMNGIYQYVKHGHVLQFDGQKTIAVYALSDSLMKHNLKDEGRWSREERELKAIIQQYMERMTQDRLKPLTIDH